MTASRTNVRDYTCFCGEPGYARGWCRPHYDRVRRYGTTEDPETVTVAERFWSKVDKSGTCWLWTAKRNWRGYGVIVIGSRTDGTRKYELAHRLSLEMHLGRPLQPGEMSLHHCDNPPCVNPEHLFVGTQADNMRDMASKGRHVGNRKLSPDDDRRIAELVSQGVPYAEIGEMYGVNKTTARRADQRVKRHGKGAA